MNFSESNNHLWVYAASAGFILFLLGFALFLRFIQKWSEGSSLKTTDQIFIGLLKQITFATIALSAGIALLIAGFEIGVSGKPLSSLSLDGQTFSGLLTLMVAVPAALASALVVISLGKNQDKLVLRELRAHDERVQHEIRSRINKVEQKFIRVWEAYEKTLYAIRTMRKRIDYSYDVFLPEHSRWVGSGVLIEDYVEDAFSLSEAIDRELRSKYPLDTIDRTRDSKKRIIFKEIDPIERIARYERSLAFLKEREIKRRVRAILERIPNFTVDTPEKNDAIDDLAIAEKVIIDALKTLIAALRDSSIESDCAAVWKNRIARNIGVEGSLLSELQFLRQLDADLDGRLYFEAVANPELHRLIARLEDIAFKFEEVIEKRHRRFLRGSNSIDLPEYHDDFETALGVLEAQYRTADASVGGGYEILCFNNFPIRALNKTLRLDRDENGDFAKIEFNALSLILLVIGTCLPVYDDVLIWIKRQGLFDVGPLAANDMEKAAALEGLLPDVNECDAGGWSRDLGDYIVRRGQDANDDAHSEGDKREVEEEIKLSHLAGLYPKEN